MKKTLNNIFDEANASEIENLVNQNAASDVSADTLSSIKNKVYAKTGITKTQNKKSLFLRWQSYVALAACFCLIIGGILGAPLIVNLSCPSTSNAGDTSGNNYYPSSAPEPSDTDNTNSSSHIQPTIPPLQMGSFDEIVNVLKNPDTQNYREEFRAKYNELFSVLKSSGFIYKVISSDDVTAEDSITNLVKDGKNIFFVMPYAQYEDAGIISYMVFRGEVYQVSIYTADEEVLSRAETISKYVETRLERDVLSEVTIKDNIICLGTVNQKNYAASFIDDNHYYVVNADVSQEDLIVFLNNLSFEKVFVE